MDLSALNRELEEVKQHVKDREATIDLLKARTKDYVAKLQAENVEKVERLEQALSIKEQEVDAANKAASAAVAAAVPPSSSSSAASAAPDHPDQREEVDTLKKRVQELTTAVVEYEKRCGDLSVSLDRKTKEAIEMRDSLNSKSAELHNCKANLNAASTSTSALQSRYDSLKKESERLNAALNAEVGQTQERKRQMKAYVDNLVAEKKAMEDELKQQKSLASHSAAKQKSAEESIKAAEAMLHSVKEQAALDATYHQKQLEQVRAAMQTQIDEREEQLTTLQKRVQESSQSSASEVQEARRKISESSKETEEHKNKRMAAKQEIVQLAQALEKVQAEAEEMNQYLQFNILPSVTEQVANMKQSLTALDRCTQRVASGRAHKFGKGDFERAFASSSSRLRSGGNGSSSSSSAYVTGPTPTVCMMDRAMDLRGELDRLQVGMTLLSQSLERLHEVVRAETRNRCCGGFFDDMSPPQISVGVGNSRPSRADYAVLKENEFMGSGGRSPR